MKTIKDDCAIKQKSFNKLEEKFKDRENLNKLKSGKTDGLSHGDIYKSTRDGVIDLNMKTDLQQDLLDNIGNNLYSAQANLENATLEVKRQGGQIDKISGDVAETGQTVKRTDKTITSMTRRAYCHKLMLNMLSVLLFIAIIIVLITKIF